ncbi:murein transglycosylase A [Candidatus Paracaedibacter symbiosus]|uniref:murein transglycosylase A n=1 Tax=Candidatus Paracaedibacter symbiosus TaxID=244582 RepID=UPI0005095073|nr:MltA domain-containing protein [Candidatus Paracaedibacter symbiosus]
MKKFFIPSFSFASLLFLVAGCQGPQSELTLTPVNYEDLSGWQDDKMIEALPAMRKSCQVLLKKNSTTKMITKSDGSGAAHDWRGFCVQLTNDKFHNSAHLRKFLEFHLKPYLISAGDETAGTFTGYYEPILRGSRKKHGPYHTPLYRLPPKSVNYKIPRSRIVAGALKGKGLELVWVDDPVAAFFIQVQGSGRVRLENGQEIRLGYDGQNGYPYFAIGKELIDRGALKSNQVNMHTIRKWLKDHPRQAESVMSKNQSYVFFKEMSGPGPIGSHGVPLTPKRSMAVDRQFISLGSPLWLDTTHPQGSYPRLQRLMMAQDTGGAIKGVVRGDFFWGHGNEAANHAGLMNSKGQLYLLLPR